MKKTLLCIIALILLVSNIKSFSQATVVSSNGYSVTIAAQPTAIVPTSNSCTYGYNYNVKLNYSITFSGTNIPSSLYTMQGTIGCGSNSHFFNLPNNGGAGNITTQSNVWRSANDCSSATVSSLSCNLVNIEIHGPGISRRVVSFTVSAAPLPVTLVDFKATVAQKKVKLTWLTATEINNDYFTIERSIDGSAWIQIAKVNGAGNSSSLINYHYDDENPVAGTAYYRIKQTDIDGRFTYSETRATKYNSSADISIFPVPSTGNTVNFINMTDPSIMKMTLLNASGITMQNQQLNSNSAELPNLAAGLYVIRLTNKITGEVSNLRYIKL